MPWATFKDLVGQIEQKGPVDCYLSEDDYDRLKPMMCRLWTKSNWSFDERLLVLAFLRGYTFYRDLSEEERSFWRSFHEELGLGLTDTNPTNSQYDELWEAFRAHPDTENKKVWDERRWFVKTIDAAWGIRSLHSSQLIKFFVAYYRRKPGKSITEDVMRSILKSIGEKPDDHLHQLASYERVFTSMTRAINVILTDELEEFADSPEQLEAELVQRGVNLGDSPNALRYFTRKSEHAVSTIITILRRQRTPTQFKKYLYKIPKRTIKTPKGQTQRANQLAASENLSFGWYKDNQESEPHEVTPDARVSLHVLETLPLNTFDDFGGIVLYTSKKPFQVHVGNRTVDSTTFYTRSREIRHLWIETLSPGLYVTVDGTTYPEPKEIARPTRSRPRKPREDICIQLDEGYFAHDEYIVIPIGDVPIGAKLDLGQRVFTKEANTQTLSIDGLAPGDYKGKFTLNNALIGKLAPFRVLPPLTWHLAHESQLLAGRIQNAQVTLDNGQSIPFQWIPRWQANGQTQPVPVILSLSEGNDVGFSLEATCVGAVFVDPETQALLDVVRSLDCQSVGVETDAFLQYKEKRFYLASNPQQVVAFGELSSLRPHVHDTLVLQVFLQTWLDMTRIPVNTTPIITKMKVYRGVCTAQVKGARDMSVCLEEVDPHSGRSLHQTVTPDEYGYVRARLRHPQKLRPLKVRLVVTSQSVPDEVIEAEVDSPPLLEMNSSLRRGFGWSRRKENP